MWNSNYLDISSKVPNFLSREQVSHRLSYLVGGIILEEMLRPNPGDERYFQLGLYALHDCRITPNVG